MGKVKKYIAVVGGKGFDVGDVNSYDEDRVMPLLYDKATKKGTFEEYNEATHKNLVAGLVKIIKDRKEANEKLIERAEEREGKTFKRIKK